MQNVTMIQNCLGKQSNETYKTLVNEMGTRRISGMTGVDQKRKALSSG